MTTSSPLRAAAATFALVPPTGSPAAGHAVTGAPIDEVIGDLKSTVVLLTDGPTRLCLIASSVPVQTVEMRAAIHAAAADVLALSPEQVIYLCSHNHCVPAFVETVTSPSALASSGPSVGRLNTLGLEFIAALRVAMQRLFAQLAPVTVEWGTAQETRITYNRRGRRSDGSAYFIREEDRLLLGEDYTGEIDPTAAVVVLRGIDSHPVAALAFFTGHPVTAYRPERMRVFGEWPQLACERLAAELGAPVAFLQGCAGDINSKYMLCGTIEQSQQFGVYLGDAFLRAASARSTSTRSGLRHHRTTVQIPFAPLPDETALETDLREIDRFIQRGHEGDPAALECVGMNFPRALTPAYRARLVEMVRPWYEWALRVQREGRTAELPRALPVDISIIRLGDVGLIAMPFEPFVRTGLKIKREAPLPCVLPCGYSGGFSGGDKGGYIPDATACRDREYMAGFYRYMKNRPPFALPAGDAVAEAAVRGLQEILS